MKIFHIEIKFSGNYLAMISLIHTSSPSMSAPSSKSGQKTTSTGKSLPISHTHQIEDLFIDKTNVRHDRVVMSICVSRGGTDTGFRVFKELIITSQ